MASRDDEQDVLNRCAAASRGTVEVAADQREANIFRLAAMVMQSRFPKESERLMEASERYFRRYPNDRVSSAEVVRNGWVSGLPRLRDRLMHVLQAQIR